MCCFSVLTHLIKLEKCLQKVMFQCHGTMNDILWYLLRSEEAEVHNTCTECMSKVLCRREEDWISLDFSSHSFFFARNSWIKAKRSACQGRVTTVTTAREWVRFPLCDCHTGKQIYPSPNVSPHTPKLTLQTMDIYYILLINQACQTCFVQCICLLIQTKHVNTQKYATTTYFDSFAPFFFIYLSKCFLKK